MVEFSIMPPYPAFALISASAQSLLFGSDYLALCYLNFPLCPILFLAPYFVVLLSYLLASDCSLQLAPT
jgi:hypothetical protein